jgi:multidrug efflux pump
VTKVSPSNESAGAPTPGPAATAADRNPTENLTTGTEGWGVSTPFILRPVATSLLSLAVVLAGLLGYWGLPVSALPQVDFPTIQVTTKLPGANPETTANLVTASLERQFGQIPSLQTMTSSSSYGLSQITMQFALTRDIDGAAQDVQAAINAAGSTLPRNLPYPPTYAKVNPADSPIVTLALTSPTVPLRAISDLADTIIAQRLSGVSGVGRVSVEGGIKPAVRIQVDLNRLSSYGLSMADVRTAITGANVSGPKGQLDGTTQSYTISANDQLTTAAAYQNVVLTYRNSAPVLLKDVASLVDGLENTKVGGWYQGQPAVIINVQRQPGANVIETVQRITAELPRLARTIPSDVKLTTVHDRTATIRASIHEVQFTLVLCVGLVVLVVLLFLRNLRATIIAGVALPMSLIATFAVMWAAGFSLDNLSLMALTIGTGFVIDDAIVMIENIVRRLDEGEDPLSAAIKGAREIGFTVISLTLSLIAVFIPLLFMTGIVGRMFREFALTLTIAVVVSAIVSLTLTPMMCAKLLRHVPPKPTGGQEPKLGALDRFIAAYGRSVDWVLGQPALTLLVTLATLVLTVMLYAAAPKGFLPAQDTALMTAALEGGPEVSFEEMTRLSAEVSAQIASDPDVTGVVAVVGVSELNPTPNAAQLKITLTSRDVRTTPITNVIKRLETKTSEIAGVRVYYLPVQDIQIATRVGRAQYQHTLVGTNATDVALWSSKLTERLKTNPLLADVTLETQEGGLRALVNVDRAAAGRLGVSMQAVNDVLNDAFGQRQISTIYAQANQYRVVLEALPASQRDATILDRLYVQSTLGTQVPLSTIASIEQTTAPLSVQREAQFPAATISFNLAPGASLSDAVAAINATTTAIGMPTSVSGSFSGDALEFTKALEGQPWLILAAVITIYIVLGVLYESFIHPFTILTSLPSAGIGALLALHFAGLDLSLVALIGIILLMGIVKKNAIMMIDFALEAERVEGLSPRDAIRKAAVLRFRPIMMTTFAALIGAIPLAFGTGTGSELRVPLGVSIIGGLLLSQILTLYTTPVIYLEMERLKAWFMTPRGMPVPAASATIATPQSASNATPLPRAAE